jgi:hydrogenase maturation protein HypF
MRPGVSALRVQVTGQVQGVGFRPFVHRLALRHGLGGWVRNESGAVEIEVEGVDQALAEFLRGLQLEAPPLARIEAVRSEPCPPAGSGQFSILDSVVRKDRRQPVPPDIGLCAGCEAELFDPADRRFRYPFITCTDCGPRFTVIESLPYDRERTSMRAFPPCPECRREYHDPQDRRYRSETNSCPGCGPRLWFEGAGGGDPAPDGESALAAAAALLRAGGVLALRGLGGFHLAADATDEPAVARLRRRKRREAKPLAIMVRTLEDARALGEVGPGETRLLRSPERPVVLLRQRSGCGLAPSVAPGLDTVGVMLAYTPMHHLLLDLVARPLVMTSGNRSEEPIAIGNAEARTRLADIADGFLLHDREIVARYDDSVLRVAGGAPVFLRRARGYAPSPLSLPVASPLPLVAVGPHLKNTITLVHGDRAWPSQHIGDLDGLETLEHFGQVLERFRTLFSIEPRVAVRDLHPGYLSTRLAEELGLAGVLAVQHHHAHIAAVMAEHGRVAPVVGIAYDGTGHGDDGRTWGAEVLLADLSGYRRLAHLRYAPMPGGDLAARTPWRAACGYLSLEPAAAPAFELALAGVDPRERAVAERQAAARLNAPLASSMGRLFDAAAAVLGVRRVSDYEGQAAMELEALAGRRPVGTPARAVELRDGESWVLDPVPLLAELGERRQAGEDVRHLAAVFHEAVATATVELAERAGSATGLGAVALGGGVFQNARLLTSVREQLERRRFTVLVPRRLSANDGAVSYGQAAVAAALLTREGQT